MTQFIIFIGWTGILMIEGFCIATLIARITDFKQRLALALPCAALSNVLILFLNTVIHVPLKPAVLLLEHTLVVITIFFAQKNVRLILVQPCKESTTMNTKIVRSFCRTILLISLLFSFSHAVLLPSYQIDSFTNWTMRSKISFYDHSIAFDTDESRGMAKPQYPILVHSLQIIVNEGNREWNDHSANAILWLLTLSYFTALFLLLQRLRGTDVSLLAVTLLISTPLLGFHLAVQYGDIHLVTMLLLSLAALLLWLEEKNMSWLSLSALFVTASVWTKSEGLIVGLLPWLCLIALLCRTSNKITVVSWHLAILSLSFLWPLFLIIRGLGLTPHETDFHIAFHPEGFLQALSGLFAAGSFGVTWFCLACAMLLLTILAYRKDPRVDQTMLLTSLWGLAALVIVLFTYLFTPNVAFLLSGQSYYRPLMIPVSMLILSCFASWKLDLHKYK